METLLSKQAVRGADGEDARPRGKIRVALARWLAGFGTRCWHRMGSWERLASAQARQTVRKADVGP